MASNAKTAVNPLNAALPQLFKRGGEVRKNPSAGRFSRAVSIRAAKLAPALRKVFSLTIETPIGLFVLSRGMSELIQSEDGLIEALIIQGWEVTATSSDVIDMLPANTQLALPELDAE
jgi:hypothetical protein